MLKLIPFPATYPSQSRTSGTLTPAMQHIPNKTPGQLNTDQIHFGAKNPDMPFRQDHSQTTAGTAKDPISPNNCLVCSVKNLLVYYGFSPEIADNCIQTILTTEANDAANSEDFSPTYPNQYNPDEQELNHSFVRNCLKDINSLNMGIQVYDKQSTNNRILESIDKSLPILVCANGDRPRPNQATNEENQSTITTTPETHTLAADAPGKGHDIVMDHAYLVVPDLQNKQQWKVIDPWRSKPTIITKEQLKNNLNTMQTENQTKYWVITKPPDESRVNIYSKETTTNEPVQKASETEEIKQLEPTTQQASPTSSNSEKKPHKGFLTRIGDWFKQQWQKVVNTIKRFGRWLKKPFFSK